MSSPAESADTRNSLNEPMQPSSKCNAPADIDEKLTALTTVLADDLNACDMKWTFFVAAASSYRHETIMKPYPMHPTNGKPYEIENLREIIAKVPPFSALLTRLRAKQPIDEEVVHLIHWMLVHVRDPHLKSVDRSNVS